MNDQQSEATELDEGEDLNDQAGWPVPTKEVMAALRPQGWSGVTPDPA